MGRVTEVYSSENEVVKKSRMEVFCKKGVLRNFVKITGKHLCQSLFFIKKEALTQVFSCDFYEISKNTFFIEHLRTTASVNFSYRGTKYNLTSFTKN